MKVHNVRGNPPSKNLSTPEIFWLAGFLDGEGSFILNNGCPRISVPSTDQDLIERCQALCGGTIYFQEANKYQENRKPQWKLHVNAVRAAGLMMTLYPLLSKRRQGKVREVLTEWRSRPTADVFKYEREACK